MGPGDFVTADTHFGHANILKYQPNRRERWATIEEHDEGLIEAWNARVPQDALVYHLGDFAFGTWATARCLTDLVNRLNGRIILIRGNHDWCVRGVLTDCFYAVHDYVEVRTPDKTKVCLFHYPMATWNAGHYGAWHLHGHSHSHGGLPDGPFRRMDVGVDGHPDFAPWSFDEVAAFLVDKNDITKTGRHARGTR